MPGNSLASHFPGAFHLPGASQVAQWVKNLPAGDSGDTISVPSLGRPPVGGHCNRLRYSCLGNPMDREVWWATVHGDLKELAIVTKPPPQSIKIVIWPGKGMKLKFCNFMLTVYN